MSESHIVLMGDPTHFSIVSGANPHTRTVWGRRKRVNPEAAILQWHTFAQTLGQYGVRVLVVPPNPVLTGLVYPANAGLLYPLDEAAPIASKAFYLANLLPSRAGEQPVYARFLERCGFQPRYLRARFEGEADFFPAAGRYLFTYGQVKTQRFRVRIGWPPYKRTYGFRSEIGALEELRKIVGDTDVVPLELRDEAYYHGDTTLCAFGPQRQFLLAYLDGLMPAAVAQLHSLFQSDLIPLNTQDAALYAANSFTLTQRGASSLFMPAGVSDALQAQIRERGVEPVLIDVGEFLRKGGGAVKCMIADLGSNDETGLAPTQLAFRSERDYRTLFSTGQEALQ